ncbi:MAG: hypothetical protein WBP88_09620 [Nitrososphaeraceae archaeon]
MSTPSLRSEFSDISQEPHMIVTFTSQPYLKGSSESPYFFEVVVSPSHSEVLRKSFSFKEQEQEQE